MKPQFTIRIYGIFIKDGQLLLSQERYGEVDMLKFPGGGMEFGESTIDCLIREMLEEYQLDIIVKAHFYTTDFFVKSAFHQDVQVMSIYYLIDIVQGEIPVHIRFEHDKGDQYLLWKNLHELEPESLTFPIDQRVINLLKALKT